MIWDVHTSVTNRNYNRFTWKTGYLSPAGMEPASTDRERERARQHTHARARTYMQGLKYVRSQPWRSGLTRGRNRKTWYSCDRRAGSRISQRGDHSMCTAIGLSFRADNFSAHTKCIANSVTRAARKTPSRYRPFPRARREFGTSIAPCRLGRLGLPFNRSECTVISLDEHI